MCVLAGSLCLLRVQLLGEGEAQEGSERCLKALGLNSWQSWEAREF